MSSTRKKRPPTVLLLLLLLPLSNGLFPAFRNDGFADNILSTLTNFDIEATGHSLVKLDDGSIIISGILRYPSGMATYPTFQDEPDIQEFDTLTDIPRYAGMVLRVFNNGTRAWAKRTALCKPDSTFNSVYDGDFVYVAGGTTGIPQGLGTPSCCTNATGMVLIKYDINGTQVGMVVHGDPGEQYTGIALTPTESDTLFLTSCTPSDVGPYKSAIAKAPSENGLTVSRVRKRDLESVQQEILSDATAVEGELKGDLFNDMAVSSDGSAIYVAAFRNVVTFGTTKIPAVFSIRGNNLTTAYTKLLDNHLQVDMRIATWSGSNGVYLSYVDRRSNKEKIVVMRMTKDLTDEAWGNGMASVFRYRIKLETEFLREMVSTVKDVHVDGGSTVRVLLNSAEVVNSSLLAPEASPPPSFERHRRLNNGRPALVVISPFLQISHILQVQTEQQWEGYRMVLGSEEHVIVGADRGLMFEGVPKVLLTGIERRELASPSASPITIASPSGLAGPSVSPTGVIDCLGESTRFFGKGIREIVRENEKLRLQRHPGRWGRQVEVVCYSWRNGTEDVLCATEEHVVRFWGRVMYMKEFCEEVECDSRVEGVVNFKGSCGEEIVAHEVLSVTMHAGGVNAAETVREECELMKKMKWWWWLTTL